MARWIRWQGLVAFLVVTISLSLIWLILVDGIVERLIERQGTRAVGAKVELDGVDVTLFPLGFTLKRLQVTDPEKPMTNAAEIARISGQVDGLNLLSRKVIIEELTVSGVQFGTTRSTSGAIRARKGNQTEKEPSEGLGELTIPSFKLPTVEEILAKDELKSLKLVESLRADINSEKARWTKELASLPGKKEIERYEKRIKKLRSATKGSVGVFDAAADVQKLQKEINADLNRIKQAQQEFDVGLSTLKKRLEEVGSAPGEDLRRLMDKYTLSPQGLANLSGMLFGEKINGWVQQVLVWSDRLKPFLERAREDKGNVEVVKPLRGRGVDVRFKESAPLPDFLIRLLDASLELKLGRIAGKLQNITPDQDVLGRPLTFAFSGEKLKDVNRAKLDGTIGRVSRMTATDRFNLEVRGYEVKDVAISESGSLPITLAKGLVDVDLEGVVSNGVIDTELKTHVGSARFSGETKGETGPLIEALRSALSDIKRFDLTALVSGTLEDYKVGISSDLDEVLKQAVGSQVKKQVARLEKKLGSTISSKIAGPLKGAKGDIASLDQIGGDLENLLEQFTGLKQESLKKQVPGGIKLPF